MTRRPSAITPAPDRSGDRVLTMPEIAKLTRLSEGTLRYLRHVGRGPKLHKLGRILTGWESEVIAWIDEQD